MGAAKNRLSRTFALEALVVAIDAVPGIGTEEPRGFVGPLQGGIRGVAIFPSRPLI